MIRSIVITGGAGYIGSHLSFVLAINGYRVIILDRDVSKFPPELAHTHAITLIAGDCSNQDLMSDIFSTYSVYAVVHMAAYIEVGASNADPYEYYENNCSATLSLLRSMRAAGVNKFIFSSSCAVFGNPQTMLLDEHHVRAPISPYGRTKYIVELMLEDARRAYGLHAVIIRYFNAAGAAPEYNLGERHIPESHLIPCLLAAAYQRKGCTIFGNDYPTKDGTCVRDYVHVLDLAQAHLQAIDLLQKQHSQGSFNIGTGIGYSVAEVVAMVEHVTGYSLQTNHQPRRIGDPPILVANPAHAHAVLGWRPRMSDLYTIVHTAHQFFIQNF